MKIRAPWQASTFEIRQRVGEDGTPYWREVCGEVRDIWGIHFGEVGPFGQRDWILTHLPSGIWLHAHRNRRVVERVAAGLIGYPCWDGAGLGDKDTDMVAGDIYRMALSAVGIY